MAEYIDREAFKKSVCRGTYWEHEVVFNENGLLRSLLE